MIFHIALFERGRRLWYAASLARGAIDLIVRRAARTMGRTADGIRLSCSETVIRAAALITVASPLDRDAPTVTSHRRSGAIA